MIISVASGKGGTGKTTVATNLALSIGSKVQLLDCDVEQPNAHLFIHPVVDRTETVTTPVPVVDMNKCTLCEKCGELWAIDFLENTCGEWFVSDTRFGPMVHARLGIAEENSGNLVTLVRQEARKLAEEKKLDLILTDGPPGGGLPGDCFHWRRQRGTLCHRTHRFRQTRYGTGGTARCPF